MIGHFGGSSLGRLRRGCSSCRKVASMRSQVVQVGEGNVYVD